MPNLTKNYSLGFYGGEPLLSFSLIKETVSFLNNKNKELKKRAHYAITTNGSLLTDEILQFLSEHKFSVELSFDGLAQDILRKKGSYKAISSKIGELLSHPDIILEVNSVFTPFSVACLSESIKSIMEIGVPNIRVSFSTIESWSRESLVTLEEEMTKLRKIVIGHYKKEENIPIVNFRNVHAKGIFYCAAGKDRLAIATNGEIWGCYLFPDYFKGTVRAEDEWRGASKAKPSPGIGPSDYKKFSFGSLENFIKNHRNIYPLILRNYSKLSMDNFSTPKMECFLCDELEICAVCPINAALSGVHLGEIPDHICKISKIKIREREKFRKESSTAV